MKGLAALFVLASVLGCADASVRKDVSAECRSSSDCPQGLICSRGVCEDVNPSLRCRDDNECPTGQDCVNGFCEAPRTPRPPPQVPR